MKIKASKANQERRLAVLKTANRRYVRHDGNTYLIHVAQVGKMVFADAENVKGGAMPVSLFGNDPLGKELRKLVENRLFS